MNWLQKIALPIKVTPEIDAFAEKCIDILFGGNVELARGGSFYKDTLMFNDKSILVDVMIRKPELSRGYLATMSTPANRKDLDNPTYHLEVFDTIPPKTDKRTLKKIIIHELIHSVDIKLNDPNLFDTDWHQKHTQNNRSTEYPGSHAYFTAPWEQDAYMSSEAYDQVSMWKRNGVSLERALQELRNHIADDPIEQIWKKSPDLWKRYMQTMARAVQEIYQSRFLN